MAQFRKKNRRESFTPRLATLWPLLFEWDSEAGSLSYYFWQDLWAAKKIFQRNPAAHFDVASRVDGFVAHVLSFRPVTLIDIRPLPYKIEGLDFIQGNATDMSAIKDNSVESLSSLCAIEHFGMGRYGDPVDPEACFIALREMQRVLAPGGRLYIAVPIGRENIYFNAHRIFSPRTILSSVPELHLIDFAVIDSRRPRDPIYTEHADPNTFENEESDEALIGLFEFEK
jgi:SAM-dependent methyltransferase